ncbi:MAG TPA: glycosyltransferase family 39 protein [Candidatus Saccharimonadales bacterium]|nr:glycosyltransferase family 39 protein [Candidatus Saccharimonadales bacterium]
MRLRLRAWYAELLIGLTALAVIFLRLGASGLRHSESRWAEIAREMLLSGDFFHPTIGWKPYFDKPLLTYWLVAGVAALTRHLNEWAVRAPSALAGVIAVVATMYIGRKLWSPRVGRIAGLLLLTSYGFLTWARNAQADMENLAAITLALAWYWSRRDRPAFTTFLGFYLVAFVGALTKGLPAVIVPLLALAPDLLPERRWRRLLSPGHILAAGLGLMIYLAPFAYAHLTRPPDYAESGLGLVFRENFLRYFRAFDHKGPIYLYLYYLPYLILPWAPLLIASVVGCFRIRREMDPRTRWLAWSALLIFAFFTLSGSRRGYYILPLLPFCALLIPVVFIHARSAAIEPVRRWGWRLQAWLLGALIAVELAGVPVARLAGERLGLAVPGGLLWSMPFVGAVAALLGYAGYALGRRSGDAPARALAAMLGAAIGLGGGLVCVQRDMVDMSRTERPFVSSLAERTLHLAPAHIGVFGSNGTLLLFYLKAEGPLTRLRSGDEVSRFLAGEGERVVVTRRRFMKEVRRAAPDQLRRPPDLVQKPARENGRPSGSDWVAWVNPAATAGSVSDGGPETSTSEPQGP